MFIEIMKKYDKFKMILYVNMKVILVSILMHELYLEYEWDAIQWLLDCGLIHKVSRVNELHMPLKAYRSMNAYKLFVLDLGLLGALSELAAESISTLKYMEQEWMVNIPLYAVCNL